MARREKKRNRPGARARSQRLVDHSISQNTLTATITALELDTQSLPTPDDTLDFPNDKDNDSSQEVEHNASTPYPFSSANWDDKSDTKEAPPDDTTTVAQQVEILYKETDTEVSSDSNIVTQEDDSVTLSPLDRATIDVLKLCHDAGVSLEFYNTLFALLRKHSSENCVDITHHSASKT